MRSWVPLKPVTQIVVNADVERTGKDRVLRAFHLN